jgi:hypothetical protein
MILLEELRSKNETQIRDILGKRSPEELNSSVGYTQGDTILLAAIRNKDFEIAEILITYQLDLDARDVQGKTALHLAASKQKFSLIYNLLNKGANLLVSDSKGNTPMHDLLKTAPLLWEALSEKEQTEYTLAAGNNSLAVFDGLRRQHEENYIRIVHEIENITNVINERNQDGMTPLSLFLTHFDSRSNTDSVIIESMRSRGASMPDENEILEIAKGGKYPHVVKILFDLFIEMSQETLQQLKAIYPESTKPFMFNWLQGYATEHNLEFIDYDIKPGVEENPEIQNTRKLDNLFDALTNGDMHLAQNLVNNGAVFNPYEGRFSVFAAAKAESGKNFIKTMLGLRTTEGFSLVNVNHRDLDNRTLLDIYEEQGDTEMQLFLKYKGATYQFNELTRHPNVEEGAQSIHGPEVKAATSYSVIKGRELFASELKDGGIERIFETVKMLAANSDNRPDQLIERLEFLAKHTQAYDNINSYKYIPSIEVSGKEAVAIAYCFIKDVIEHPQNRITSLNDSFNDTLEQLVEQTLFQNIREAASASSGRPICQLGTFNKVFDMRLLHKYCFVIPEKFDLSLHSNVVKVLSETLGEKSITAVKLRDLDSTKANMLNDVLGSARNKLDQDHTIKQHDLALILLDREFVKQSGHHVEEYREYDDYLVLLGDV